MQKFTINQVLANPDLYNQSNCFGFYDWFCRDSSLEARYKRALVKVKQMVKLGLIDGDKHTFWLKNNCPMSGSLYDDIRFNTVDGDEYIGGVAPSLGYASMRGKCDYWLASEGFESNQFENWAAFKKFAKANNIKFEAAAKSE